MVGTNSEILESTKDISCRLKSNYSKVSAKDDDRIIYADEIPVDEGCLEIHDSPEICLSPSIELTERLSPVHQSTKDTLHSFSDCGYESHGSPLSLEDFRFGDQQDDLNYLLSDLFPALTT